MLTAAVDGSLNLDWLGPVITTTGVVIVGAITGVSAIIRRNQNRKDALEDKLIDREPSEKDGWAEVREARAEATKYYKLYRIFEDMYYAVASALRYLARKTHDAHPEITLDKTVVDALALRPPDIDTK